MVPRIGRSVRRLRVVGALAVAAAPDIGMAQLPPGLDATRTTEINLAAEIGRACAEVWDYKTAGNLDYVERSLTAWRGMTAAAKQVAQDELKAAEEAADAVRRQIQAKRAEVDVLRAGGDPGAAAATGIAPPPGSLAALQAAAALRTRIEQNVAQLRAALAEKEAGRISMDFPELTVANLRQRLTALKQELQAVFQQAGVANGTDLDSRLASGSLDPTQRINLLETEVNTLRADLGAKEAALPALRETLRDARRQDTFRRIQQLAVMGCIRDQRATLAAGPGIVQPPLPPSATTGVLNGSWGVSCSHPDLTDPFTMDGTFQLTVRDDLLITGTYLSGGKSFAATGTMDRAGTVSGTAQAEDGTAIWSGTITGSGSALAGSGPVTLSNPAGTQCSGQWRGP